MHTQFLINTLRQQLASHGPLLGSGDTQGVSGEIAGDGAGRFKPGSDRAIANPAADMNSDSESLEIDISDNEYPGTQAVSGSDMADEGPLQPASACVIANPAADTNSDSEALEIELSENEAPASENEGAAMNDANSHSSGAHAPSTDRVSKAQALPESLLKGALAIPRKTQSPGNTPAHFPACVCVEAGIEDTSVGEKRALKRSEMDEVDTRMKKGKRTVAEGTEGPELRDLAKVKIQEMTAGEMQAKASRSRNRSAIIRSLRALPVHKYKY
jgi:hypothetical protein